MKIDIMPNEWQPPQQQENHIKKRAKANLTSCPCPCWCSVNCKTANTTMISDDDEDEWWWWWWWWRWKKKRKPKTDLLKLFFVFLSFILWRLYTLRHVTHYDCRGICLKRETLNCGNVLFALLSFAAIFVFLSIVEWFIRPPFFLTFNRQSHCRRIFTGNFSTFHLIQLVDSMQRMGRKKNKNKRRECLCLAYTLFAKSDALKWIHLHLTSHTMMSSVVVVLTSGEWSHFNDGTRFVFSLIKSCRHSKVIEETHKSMTEFVRHFMLSTINRRIDEKSKLAEHNSCDKESLYVCVNAIFNGLSLFIEQREQNRKWNHSENKRKLSHKRNRNRCCKMTGHKWEMQRACFLNFALDFNQDEHFDEKYDGIVTADETKVIDIHRLYLFYWKIIEMSNEKRKEKSFSCGFCHWVAAISLSRQRKRQ